MTVFTLCSSNYLAHAKALGDSLIEHNVGAKFVIGLVDRVPKALSSSYWQPYELLPVEDLRISQFDKMREKYTIVELNTAVKPFYAEHLFRRDSNAETVIYLDPDIIVYGTFKKLLERLQKNSIVVTPHSCGYNETAANVFYEISMLATGIYNLGFIGLARTETTLAFLRWWQNRLGDYCYYKAGSGMFVDQIWLTLAPLYFPDIYVEKSPGYNMCYWNHFERTLSTENGRYRVNGSHDLIFYHFSSFSVEHPEIAANRSQALSTAANALPELQALYRDYRDRLLAREYQSINGLKPQFGRKPPTRTTLMKKAIRHFAHDVVALLPEAIRKPIKATASSARKIARPSHPASSESEAVWLLR